MTASVVRWPPAWHSGERADRGWMGGNQTWHFYITFVFRSNIQKHHQLRALSKLGPQRPCGTPELYGVFMSLSELKLERNLTRPRGSFSATLE